MEDFDEEVRPLLTGRSTGQYTPVVPVSYYPKCQSTYPPSDLHSLRNPQDYLGGTYWKIVILEAHLKE